MSNSESSKDNLSLEDKQEEFQKDAFEPTFTPTAEPKQKPKAKKVKTAKEEKKLPSGAKNTPQQRMKEGALCSFCTNPMRMSKNMNWKDVAGLKGYKGVLCDTCESIATRDPDRIDIKTVVSENADGSITNIPVGELITQPAASNK